jgi:hypothetical protein
MMLWIIAVIVAVVLLDIPWKTGDPQYLVYTWTDDWAWSCVGKLASLEAALGWQQINEYLMGLPAKIELGGRYGRT